MKTSVSPYSVTFTSLKVDTRGMLLFVCAKVGFFPIFFAFLGWVGHDSLLLCSSLDLEERESWWPLTNVVK